WLGRGLVDIVRDFKPHIGWADFIILADNVKTSLREFDRIRDDGKPVLGPSYLSAKWEIDRALGQEVLQAAGIKIIPSTEFDSLDAAIKHVRKHDKAFVSKPTNDGDSDKMLSYCAK